MKKLNVVLKAGLVLSTAFFVVGGFFVPVPKAFADAAVTPASGGINISADKAGNALAPAYTSLGDIVVAETIVGDFALGSNVTLILSAPSGWEFEASAGSVALSGADVSNELISVTASEATVEFDVNDVVVLDSITISGLKVRALDGASLPGSGEILNSGSAVIAGVSGATSFGSLSQVAGDVAQIVFSTEPGGAEYGSILSPQPVIKTEDQFGNDSVSGLGASEMITLTLSGGTGALLGDVDLDIGSGAGAGTVAFIDIEVDTAGAGKVLTATSVNYGTAASNAFEITPKALTASVVVNDKDYDGTTSAVITNVNLIGVEIGDDVTVDSQGTATFDTPDAGSLKAVTSTGVTIAGADVANYTFGNTASGTADINPLGITITPTAGQTKVYGESDPVFAYTFSPALIAPDVITGNLSRDAGEDAGAYAYTLGSLDAGGNYALVVGPDTFTISPRDLTVTATGVSKVYDGTTDAAVTLSSDEIPGDNLTLDYTNASFLDKAVGAAKQVDVSGISISGAKAGNYNLLNTTEQTTADITPKTLTATLNINNKTYNGTTSAVYASLPTPHVELVGVVLGDVVVPDDGTSKAFSDKHVGTAKTVTATGITLSGADASNYSFDGTGTGTADILVRPITVTAQTDTKVYDGTNTSSVIPIITVGAVQGTDVAEFIQAYDTANAGTGKTLTPSGAVNDGNGGANYAVTFVNDTTGEITGRPITVTSVGNTKIYDGNTDAATLPAITAGTLAPGDTANFIETYNTKNVGAGKALIPSGSVDDGNGGANYAVTFVNSTNGIITAKELTVDGLSAADKTYDGNTSAVVSGTISLMGVVGVEDVAVSGTAAGNFVDKNAGAGKDVAVSGLSLTGSDAGNYTLTQPTLGASILQAPLLITAQTNTKVYDGDVSAAALPLVSGLVGGDTATGLAETYDDKNVGTGKTLSVSAYTINDGNGGANYSITTQADATGAISQRPITVTSSANTKAYDGDTSASAVPDVTAGTIAPGDTANFTETYDTKDVGAGKTLVSAGSVTDGNGGANYAVTFVNSANGVINAIELSIDGAIGNNKVYDGDNTAIVDFTGASLVGVVAPDDVTIDASGYSAIFDNENVGNGKPIAVVGVAIAGADAGNYTLSQPSGLSADITARPITVTASTGTKTYDGTNSSAEVPVITAGTLAVGDSATWSQTYDDKNVGTGKTLTPDGIVTDGNGGNNYEVTFAADTSGVITEKTLTISAVASGKVYDGNTTASVTFLDDRVAGDSFTISYASADFSDKNVGANKAVSVNGISISGADQNNYTFNTTANTTASITSKPLVVSAAASNKVYDGTATASVIFSSDEISGDDVVVTDAGATFSDKNVGVDKTATANFTVTGADAGNYSATASPVLATADITAKDLTVTATGVDKVYDGNTSATVNLSDDRVAGDVLSVSYTGASFADSSVGTAKSVSVSGIAISGADAGNYNLLNTTANTTANINPVASSSGGGSRRITRPLPTPAGEVLGAAKYVFTLFLKQGSIGPEVMELQKFLNTTGYGILAVDGKFGPLTRAAVVKFQLANGLVGDGLVGPLTRAVLNK